MLSRLKEPLVFRSIRSPSPFTSYECSGGIDDFPQWLVAGWLIEETTWIARTAQKTPQPIETRVKNRRPGINEITSATVATTAAAVGLAIAPGLDAPSELKVVECRGRGRRNRRL